MRCLGSENEYYALRYTVFSLECVMGCKYGLASRLRKFEANETCKEGDPVSLNVNVQTTTHEFSQNKVNVKEKRCEERWSVSGMRQNRVDKRGDQRRRRTMTLDQLVVHVR